MATPKKYNDKEWLETSPEESEIEVAPTGGKHIPIDKLRPLLDRLNACTNNYHTSILKDGYSNYIAYGSIELTVTIDDKQRTVTGAYNLLLGNAPNGFWNGTLKSECVKNAAIELGKRFGRELNKDAPQPIQQPSITNEVKDKLKSKPDSRIMKQYLDAIERNDQAAITTLTNIYDIQK